MSSSTKNSLLSNSNCSINTTPITTATTTTKTNLTTGEVANKPTKLNLSAIIPIPKTTIISSKSHLRRLDSLISKWDTNRITLFINKSLCKYLRKKTNLQE